MTHLSVPPEERAVLGITDTLVILLVNTLIVNKPAVVNKLFLLINLLLLISYCLINVFCVSIIISINWRGMPTKIGVHAFDINPNLHDFFEPILSN